MKYLWYLSNAKTQQVNKPIEKKSEKFHHATSHREPPEIWSASSALSRIMRTHGSGFKCPRVSESDSLRD